MKSKRYMDQMARMHEKEPRQENEVAEYTNFNIEPGMSAWTDMPEDYKQAFAEQQKLKEMAAAERLRIQREKDAAEKLPTEEDRKFMKDRIAKMEKMFAERKHTTPSPKVRRRGIKTKSVNVDASVCNFIDGKFFELKYKQITSEMNIKKNRPKILLIADVCGWAWWNKSHYLRSYLANDYEIDIICTLGPEARGINRGRYDLYVTYGYSYIHLLQGIPRNKKMTGITAHRPIKQLKAYMELAGHLHANSLLLLSDLKKMVRHNNLHYVPNGVDHELFKPVKPLNTEGPLVAGHVGKKCPAKGQEEYLIPAMNAAGVKSIHNLSDYRNRSPYCEMYNYYQDMDVFLVASIEDGTPNPALEAAACGRPIISNNIGNMPEFIKDGYNGFLVPRERGAYIEKLKFLSKNRDALVEMGENARKTVEEGWSWKIQAENWRKTFNKILKR